MSSNTINYTQDGPSGICGPNLNSLVQNYRIASFQVVPDLELGLPSIKVQADIYESSS